MPFKSEAQRKMMYATNKDMAKKWSNETPKNKPLPKRADKATARVKALNKLAGK